MNYKFSLVYLSWHKKRATWSNFVITASIREPARRCVYAANAEVRCHSASVKSTDKHHVRQRRGPLLPQVLLCLPQVPPLLLLHRVLGELKRFRRSSCSLPGFFVWPCFMGWGRWTCGLFPRKQHVWARANTPSGQRRGVRPLAHC